MTRFLPMRLRGQPFVLLALGLLVVAASLFPGLRAAEAFQAGRALDRGAYCTTETGSCLRRVPVELVGGASPGEDYPYPPSTETWSFATADGALTGRFDVDADAAGILARSHHDHVGLFYGDHLVAVDSASQPRVETAYAGPRGALRSALFTLALLAVALLLVTAAGVRRRASGSWWSIPAVPPDYSGGWAVSQLVGWTMLALFAVGMMPFGFGGLTWLSLCLMAVTLAAAVLVFRPVRVSTA